MSDDSKDPAREYPDGEIDASIDSHGGWIGWLGANPDWFLVALRWKTMQGDDLPEELEELRDTLAQFGHSPIEAVTARVIGLERAFAEISELMKAGISVDAKVAQEIRDIVDTCVKFSGDYGVERRPFSAIFDREVAP